MHRPERLFWLELGYRFGEWDIESLQRRMSPDQFMEWRAFEKLYPRGERRADARHAINTWWIARTMGGVKDAKYGDFIPEFKFESSLKPQQTVEEAVRVAMRINAMCKGTVH